MVSLECTELAQNVLHFAVRHWQISKKHLPWYQPDNHGFLSSSNGFWMGVWYWIKHVWSHSQEKHDICWNVNIKFDKIFGGQQQCSALDWVFQRGCMEMGVSGSVTTSFPPPVIRGSPVLCSPHRSILHHQLPPTSPFSHSPLSHHPVWFMDGVGVLTGQPSGVLCSNSFPAQSPRFKSQTHQKG